MSRIARSLLALLLLPVPAVAQSSALPIGGHGSLSSEGYDDPGLLGDGETQGRARLEFNLDVPAATLTLVVQNFSPVKPGIPNPVITRVYFNTPPGITGMTLISQSAAKGDVEPTFELTLDADLGSSPQPNTAGRFGAFNARLDNGDGVHGAIANADADTIAPGDPAIGPVTFVIALEGDLSEVTPADFVSERSTNPPGEESVVAVAKFQSGGRRESSAFISGGDPFCELAAEAEDLGGGCGPRLVCTDPVQGETWKARVESAPPGALGVLVIAPLPARPVRFHGCDILVDLARGYRLALFTTDANGEGGVALKVKSYYYSVECCGIEGIVQVGFRTGTVFQGATNACRILLGS